MALLRSLTGKNFAPPQTGDVLAGLSVAFVAIPQALAYAELAGLPAKYGLYAVALPSLLAAAFVSSRYLQTGPVALTSLLSFGALSVVVDPEADMTAYIELAALLAVMVGIIRVLLGVLRLGRVAYLLSETVTVGFTAAAAALIISSQLPRIVDVDIGDRSVLEGALWAVTRSEEWNWASVAFAAVTVVLMLGGKWIHHLFPGVLVAVIGGVIVVSTFGYSGAVVGDIDGGFVNLHLDFRWGEAPSLLLPAAVIALAGFAEAASVSRQFAAADRLAWNADREMISQGVANLASGVAGAFPVGGSFSRSSLNRAAGAATAWSGAVTGIVVLAVLPLAPLLENLPLAVLGAVVIVVVSGLVKVPHMIHMLRRSFPQAVVGAGTTFATLLFAPRVERGLLVGLALAVAVHLWRELFVTIDTERSDGTLTIRPHGVMWFATVTQVERLMREELAGYLQIDQVVIDLGNVGRLDYSGAAGLHRVLNERVPPDVQVRVVSIPDNASRAVLIELRDYIA